MVDENPADADKVELFVKNISLDTWDTSLKELFGKFGELVKCKHMH